MGAVLSIITLKARMPIVMGLFFSVILMGCGPITTGKPSGTCETGTAQFQVLDGAIQRICGCTEGTGIFTNTTPFNCTVSARTVLYFYYSSISVQQQVVVTGNLTLNMSPSDSTKVASMVMTQTGSFALSSNTGVSGTIIVTP